MLLCAATICHNSIYHVTLQEKWAISYISQPEPNGDNSTSASRSWATRDSWQGVWQGSLGIEFSLAVLILVFEVTGCSRILIFFNVWLWKISTFRLMNSCYSRSNLVLLKLRVSIFYLYFARLWSLLLATISEIFEVQCWNHARITLRESSSILPYFII